MTSPWCRLAIALILAGGWSPGPAAAQGPKNQPQSVDFAHEIVPILKARCAECHTDGKYKGRVSFDTREDLLKSEAVVPGKSADSELLSRVTSDDPDLRMPPKGEPLAPKEVALLRAWIDQGLPWEAGFTFKKVTYAARLKPRRVEVPPARPGLEHPIDLILAEYYEKNNIEPPPPAGDVAFLRRVHLDVIGLLPTPAEAAAFLADDSPDRQARLARRVLADRRAFAEHWLTFWNDLLRNDYAGTGYIDGGRKQITAWLYTSLYDNKPYDRFVRELISPAADSEGFINGIKWRGNVNASQKREVQFAQNVSLVFFGANMKCASCHDSFIDSWKLADAYGLAAVTATEPLEVHRCDVPTGKYAEPKFLWPELGTVDPALPREKRLEQLAGLVTHAENGRFTRTLANRLWQRLMGRGLVHPVDVMANQPWNEDLLDYLAVYLSDHGYDVRQLIEHIITSRAYQSRAALLDEEVTGPDYKFTGPQVKRLTAEQFIDAVWQVTGSAPGKADAPVQLPPFGAEVPAERQFIRAALVKSDLLMRSLGRPNREQVVTTRGDVLTTLQALDLSNGEILYDHLTRGAANLLRGHPQASPESMIGLVYQKALCRPPTADELAIGCEIVGTPMTQEGVADLLWCVVMLPEFQLVR